LPKPDDNVMEEDVVDTNPKNNSTRLAKRMKMIIGPVSMKQMRSLAGCVIVDQK
jgi:hypothetical protein